jgi:hypothetical protein
LCPIPDTQILLLLIESRVPHSFTFPVMMILLRFLLCSLLFLGLKDLFAFTDSRLVSLSVCSVFGRMIVL